VKKIQVERIAYSNNVAVIIVQMELLNN